MKKAYVVDRLEGATAVLTAKSGNGTRNVAAAELPEGVKEGATVVEDGGSWSIDAADTEQRKARVAAKAAAAFKH